MGLFSKIRSVKAVRERLKNAGRLGALEVPGDATLELPAGTVHVSFELTVPNANEVDFAFVRPQAELTVPGATFSVGGGGASVSNNLTGEYCGTWGTLEVPAAGAYTVSVRALGQAHAGARVLFDV